MSDNDAAFGAETRRCSQTTEELDGLREDVGAGLAETEHAAVTDGIDVPAFVASIVRDNRQLDGNDFRVLDRLARKLEIRRELHTGYCSTFRIAPGAGLASVNLVNGLLVCYLRAYQASGDLRYLNTVFKTVLVGLKAPDSALLDTRILAVAEHLLREPGHA